MAALAAALLAALACARARPAARADLIVLGNVWTGDSATPRA